MRALIRSCALASWIVLVGCGGATSASPTLVSEAEATSARVVVPDVSAEWRGALRSFHVAESRGFDAESCSEATRAFERVNEAQGGDFAEAVYMQAVTRERCGDLSHAQPLYEQTLSMDPRVCGARVAVALAHYRAGRFEDARRELELAVRNDVRCTEAYVNLAIVQRRTPQGEAEALNNLRRALAIDATFLPAFNQMALLYLERARREGGSSQLLSLADVVCEHAHMLDPTYAPIFNTWGLVRVQQGDVVGALAKFERAFTLDESLFEAYMNFGELTLGFRGYDDAARAFGRATELRPASYDAFIGLGAARRGLGELDAAQEAYERAIAIDAGRPEGYFNLGVLDQDHRGDPAALERAITRYREFVARAGANVSFADVVTSVTRQCPPTCGEGVTASRRRRSTCAMGRIQQIEESLCIQREMATMSSE